MVRGLLLCIGVHWAAEHALARNDGDDGAWDHGYRGGVFQSGGRPGQRGGSDDGFGQASIRRNIGIPRYRSRCIDPPPRGGRAAEVETSRGRRQPVHEAHSIINKPSKPAWLKDLAVIDMGLYRRFYRQKCRSFAGAGDGAICGGSDVFDFIVNRHKSYRTRDRTSALSTAMLST